MSLRRFRLDQKALRSNDQRMKTYIFVVAVILSAVPAFAKIKVEISTSKVHSLFGFVQAIAGDSHRPPELTRTFNKSKFNDDKAKNKIKKFQELDAQFRKSVEFGKAPPGRNDGVQIGKLIEIQSAFAKTLPEFRERILSHLPVEDIEKMISTLEFFEPIYDELIWKPNVKALEKVQADFKIKTEKWKLDEMFDRAKIFYNAKWPDAQAFHVSLYPIPHDGKVSNATSLGAFESVGIIIGRADIEGNFGVLFHEMCHSLYDAQSSVFQQQLADWFYKNPSPFGVVAYGWLNEALATAIGNGWAYERAKGGNDKGEWYHQEKVDSFGRALHPKVVEYLNAKKPIDETFVTFAVKAFAEKFPQALLEFESLMADIVILTDGRVGPGTDVRRSLRAKFLMPSISGGSPIDSTTSKSLVKDTQSPVFLIALNESRAQIENLEDVLPGVGNAVKKASAKGAQFGMFDLGRRKVMILLIDSQDGLQHTIDWMGEEKHVERAGEFVAL